MAKKIKSEFKEDWWSFCENYLSMAKLACLEMLEPKHHYVEERGESFGQKCFNKYKLYIAARYNLTHSIEISLKYFFIIIEDDLPKRVHDLDEILEWFNKGYNVVLINDIIKRAIKGGKKLDYSIKGINYLMPNNKQWFDDIVGITKKYFYLKDVVKNSESKYILEDVKNDGFRYPDNNLAVRIDYYKLIKGITEDNIEEMKADIYTLEKSFNGLRFFIEVYKHVK